jgi:hypothetical protein
VISNPIEDMRAELERAHPDWHVWVIFKAVGGTIWCAQRLGEVGRVLNEDSADHLGEAIVQAEAEPPR